MTELAALYVLGVVHSGFAGFREATGRNLRIHKFRYYLRSILRGTLLGQAAAAIIFLTLIALGALSPRQAELLATLAPACRAALEIYIAYTILVLATYFPYLFPNLELRALTIVALFSILTLFLPLVILAGAAAAIARAPRGEVIILFAVSIAAIALVEPALAAGGWSSRDAARENGDPP